MVGFVAPRQAELEVEGGDEGLLAFYRRRGWRKAGTSKSGRPVMIKNIKVL